MGIVLVKSRLALLCGKYESNAIALRLALGVMDRAIEAYDVLLALLETELALNHDNEETIKNRIAAESIAKQLLQHLDVYQDTDVLLSPWQNRIFNSPTSDNENPWTAEQEVRLREHVSRLKAERSTIQGTYVVLESPQVEFPSVKLTNTQESRKMDLEMAVLIQELMGLREEKLELISKFYTVEKDKSALELKLKYVEGQQKAQAATLKNLQGQLKDTEALLAIATQNKACERGYSDAEHAQGVELELIQALAREARLKIRLQELVSTLEQVTRNAEARLLEGREMVHDLNNTNSVLAETVDRNHKKYQARLTKMEQQMINMVERHNLQVGTLQNRIAALEAPQTNSSENSIGSVAIFTLINHGVLIFGEMNQDQEVPTTEFTRFGCLFGAPTEPPCNHQHPDPYKTSPPAGNTCENEDNEQYVPDSDYSNSNNNSNSNNPSAVKPESPALEISSNLCKTYQAAHNYPEVFENFCTTNYQTNGCFYPNGIPRCPLNPRVEGMQYHGHSENLAEQLGSQLPIKQEPSDKDFDGSYHRSSYNRNKSVQQSHKDSWIQTEKLLDEKSREPLENRLQNSSGRRGSLQLWQFLVALLDTPDTSAGCIAWTGRGMEFKLIEPEEVARRWGAQKNRPAMNYDKLSRSLRYYYEKGIMQKVAGERYVYKFVCDPDALFNMAYGNHTENSIRTQISSKLETFNPKPETHHLAYTDMLNLYNCGIAHANPYQHLHPYLHDSKQNRYS
ncbi:hypothetical protein FQA39_LY09711 [Lamprigera yunnana]|nr:hypothetical protein FQA39_LY09711 [Lamprigera yunnana]